MNNSPQRPARSPVGHAVAALGLAAFLIAGQGAAAPSAAAWEMRVCADPDYMPQSNRDGEGYENKIVEILADELGAELTYQWWTLAPSMVTEQLREGNCDMMIGVPDGGEGVIERPVEQPPRAGDLESDRLDGGRHGGTLHQQVDI